MRGSSRRAGGEEGMSVLLLIAAGLIVYLCHALVYPEKY
ncbi:potassium-transporting ATPase subunit F [Brevibacillus borstelensis]|nr:potassium-transporting ATPase subunit F [Brevibacillus borstelensis]NOU53913.1 potassium-transporting ATPase subunit F [Brevibacillus borstelensis]RNB63953.1 potassium-transporting ATPase subunit F [Brevibacillus borstelensis]